MRTIGSIIQAVFAVLLLCLVGWLYPDFLKDEYANP